MDRFIIPAEARSWIAVPADSHFPIQNLPFGAGFRIDEDSDSVETVEAVAIGSYALDLAVLAEEGLIDFEPGPVPFAWVNFDGPEGLIALRRQVYDLLREDNPKLRDRKTLREEALIPLSELHMTLPMPPRAFVDFYSGIHHASNVGKMFRPDQPPLLPNYRHLPIGYNGRASSVVPSEEPITRPNGIQKIGEDIVFGPCKELDFELEMGYYAGGENMMGEPIPIEETEDYILGCVLVNDWSARDVQRFEYVPLGPFLAKSFATTISPWLVTIDALEPFRCAGMPQDPQPLPHLRQPGKGHFDIHLEVSIQTPAMRKPQVICRSNTKNLYWSFAQQLAHQTSNGTPIEVGDLYASGTISGETPDSFGSLLELTWRGQQPLQLESGETRTFLEDGDIVTMTGWCQGDGYRVGFGECSGEIISLEG